MKFVTLLSLLFIIVLTVDHGQSWSRRRRWFRKTFSKVAKVVKTGVKFYRTHKTYINGAITAASYLGKDAHASLVQLATLKAHDRESYDEFMQQLAASLEENYSAEEINEVIQEIDDVADLQPDELELTREEYDANPSNDDRADELSKNLADRVAAFNRE